MPKNTLQTIKDIDFKLLWKSARKKKAWKSKGKKEWDKKASSFAIRNINGPYSKLLLSKLPVSDKDTVLDMGSGPGTLAIPLAAKVKHVTAVDYSAGMLETLDELASTKGINNISTVKAAWEDNWKDAGITPHHTAIASRSLNVEDLAGAIEKLNRFATHQVFLVDRISPTPFDPDVYEAIGREFDSGPDYIYTINILYQLGIHPNVEIIGLDPKTTYPDMDSVLDQYRWMLKNITDDEDLKLKSYLQSIAQQNSDGTFTIERRHPLRWALIWWMKEENTEHYDDTV